MKFKFFGIEVPPQGKDNKKKVLTGAAMVVAGMAAGMSDNKLPEMPKGPLDAEAGAQKKEFKTTYEKRAEVEAAFDLSKNNLEGGDGPDNDLDLEEFGDPSDTLKVLGRANLLGNAENPYTAKKSATELGVSGPFVLPEADRNNPSASLSLRHPEARQIWLWDATAKGNFYLVKVVLSGKADIYFIEKNGQKYVSKIIDKEGKEHPGCFNLIIEDFLEDDDPQLAREDNEDKKVAKQEVKEKVSREKWLRSETWPDNYVMMTYKLSNGKSQIECTRPLLDARGRMQYDADGNLITEVIPYQVFLEHHTLGSQDIPRNVQDNVVISNNY